MELFLMKGHVLITEECCLPTFIFFMEMSITYFVQKK